MTAPLIGITTTRRRNKAGYTTIQTMEAYIKAVSLAGGVPVLIPLGLSEKTLQEMLPRLDGILFTGGGDVNSRRYGVDTHLKVDDVDSDRDRVEIQLLQDAIQRGAPFLGICRGIQLINVALGGTLYTDIADQHPGALKHNYNPGWPRNHIAHPVQVSGESRLAHILGSTEVEVNSMHHQGISRPAPAMLVTAHAPDGLIEAIELPDHSFGLAVQWHPEELQAYAPMQALFQAFVRAAAANHNL